MMRSIIGLGGWLGLSKSARLKLEDFKTINNGFLPLPPNPQKTDGTNIVGYNDNWNIFFNQVLARRAPPVVAGGGGGGGPGGGSKRKRRRRRKKRRTRK